jgi:hypothetical protein
MSKELEKIQEKTTFSLLVLAGSAGYLVGGGLLLILVLVKGWPVGLVNSPYCGACGALVGGLFFGGRFKGSDGFRFIYAAGLGLPVGLGPPLAAWVVAPLLGYGTGPFAYASQLLLGLACGWVGAWLGGRKSRLPDAVEEIRRRRLGESADDRPGPIRRRGE